MTIHKDKTILTGDRATGKLHLGHYAGSLMHRVQLQDDNNQTILIADMQGLTDNGYEPEKVSSNILNVVADYLSVGIDPNKTVICLQSALPALAELTMLYSNLVTLSRLERNPTLSNEKKNKSYAENIPVGFLTYPISQAADITAFKADLIPVGDDQLPMIEQSNEIVKKVNKITGKETLVKSTALLSSVSRLPSVDGKSKMSKSSGLVINFDTSDKDIKKIVNKMYTDCNHLNIEDKGSIQGNVVFSYLDAFYNDQNHLIALKEHYQKGGLADGITKSILIECLIEMIRPIRKERELLMNDKAELINILKKGTEISRKITQETCDRVKRDFGLLIF